ARVPTRPSACWHWRKSKGPTPKSWSVCSKKCRATSGLPISGSCWRSRARPGCRRKPSASISPSPAAWTTTPAPCTKRSSPIGAEVFPDAKRIGQQLQYAERRGFRAALIAGADEIARGVWKIKDLARREETTVAAEEVPAALRRLLDRPAEGQA